MLIRGFCRVGYFIPIAWREAFDLLTQKPDLENSLIRQRRDIGHRSERS